MYRGNFVGLLFREISQKGERENNRSDHGVLSNYKENIGKWYIDIIVHDIICVH